jgi:hypothetical protein
MALTFAHLAAENFTVDDDNVVSAAVTFTINRGYILDVTSQMSSNTNPNTPTVTISGETITAEANVLWNSTGTTRVRTSRVSFLCASTGSKTVTIDFAAQTQVDITLIVTEVTGQDLTDFIIENVTNTAGATSITGTLTGVTAGNASMASLAKTDNVEVYTPGGVALELFDAAMADTNNRLETQYDLAGPAALSASWTSVVEAGIIISEIVVVAAVVNDPPPRAGNQQTAALAFAYAPDVYIDMPMWGALSPETPGDNPPPRQIEWFKAILRSWPPIWWPAQGSRISNATVPPPEVNDPPPFARGIIDTIINRQWPATWWPAQQAQTVDQGGTWTAAGSGIGGTIGRFLRLGRRRAKFF